MQQSQQGCPFTAAAYALQHYIPASRAEAMDFRKFGAAVNPVFDHTIASAFALADAADQRAAVMAWLADFCISCAVHSVEITNLLEKLNSEIEIVRSPSRERRRINPSPVARQAGAVGEVAFLDSARAAKC